MSKEEARVLRRQVAELEGEFKFGKVRANEREIEYLKRDRDTSRQQLYAIFSILGVNPSTFQPLGDE